MWIFLWYDAFQNTYIKSEMLTSLAIEIRGDLSHD